MLTSPLVYDLGGSTAIKDNEDESLTIPVFTLHRGFLSLSFIQKHKLSREYDECQRHLRRRAMMGEKIAITICYENQCYEEY
ncbi:hypothetical protein MTR_6g088360 [Medicago truncatula]|uniref:Uncharacterized protein n=1 Tax=Medicago truncatula TaxID=3880 RepID=G7KPU8_MEDTR|nr:hypothetical protein MTR_6g088360 [Medicago truncatula]